MLMRWYGGRPPAEAALRGALRVGAEVVDGATEAGAEALVALRSDKGAMAK